MKHPNIRFLRSVGMMIGAIVGVGVFGLPYAFSQSGFPLGIIELIVVGGLLVIMQLMFAEVAVQTPG
ncbi:MAG: aromatic amino acid transport family protein, partial [bacterium]|nr:aromatic amino acid transport family protein [bacterium]